MLRVQTEKSRRTQFFLKQSCEQKKLSLMPKVKHLGHCRAEASLSQSTPRHFLLVGGSSAMVGGGVGIVEEIPGGAIARARGNLMFCKWSSCVGAKVTRLQK